MKKIVIVGGVAGGATAAARLRRLDETAEIIMFEKDEFISFANCGLPYHIGGSIPERGDLIVQTPEAMRDRFNIDVRVFSEVVAVDAANKTVSVKSERDGEYAESYDFLILAPGAAPVVPPFKNEAVSRTFSVRNIADIDLIKVFLKRENIGSAAVIGGGFVGVEMAENLREAGCDVSIIEAMENVLPPFDRETARLVEAELERGGVKVFAAEFVESIAETGKKAIIKTKSGAEIEAGIIISAVGVTPATAFLKDSGIELGLRCHIVTDDRMATNLPGIYAVGDAVLTRDFVTGQPAAVPLAGPANKQARVAADQICGVDHRYKGAQGTAIIKVFGLTAACTGASERTLKRAGMPYTAIYTHPLSSAAYYPGAAAMHCKLLFSPEGKILGCQIVGPKGVDKRIDVVATAMRLGARVTDLAELELAYAPPYSSAKDPVNMLGFVAQNILEGKTNIVDYKYVESRDRDKTILLDVRTPGEFASGHAEGAVNIPLDELRGRLSELDKSKEIVEYCRVGVRGHAAARILAENGFDAKNVTGGWLTMNNPGGLG